MERQARLMPLLMMTPQLPVGEGCGIVWAKREMHELTWKIITDGADMTLHTHENTHLRGRAQRPAALQKLGHARLSCCNVPQKRVEARNPDHAEQAVQEEDRAPAKRIYDMRCDEQANDGAHMEAGKRGRHRARALFRRHGACEHVDDGAGRERLTQSNSDS